MATNWIEQLQPASFRNVPFHVDSIDTQAGEDVVVREYPFQDLPTVHVMGEGAEEFTLRAYVIGDDYSDQRDQLANVLRGEGLLVHPTRGHIRCHVKGKYSVSENPTTEGGIARFDITFVRAEQRRYPVAKANTTQQVTDHADASAETSKQAFAESFDAQGASFMAEDALSKATDTLNSITDHFDGLHEQLEVVAQYQRDVSAVINKLTNLINLPTDLADHIANLFALDRNSDAEITVSRMQSLFEDDLTPVESAFNTPSRQQQTANTHALNSLRQSLALIQSSRALLDLDELGLYGAQHYISWYREAFNSLIAATTGWEQLQNLQNLKTAVIAHLLAHPDVTNRVSEYVPEDTQSTLYISYRLYGTTQYADEVYQNNPHIQHPLLAPAGQAIKWMSHG